MNSIKCYKIDKNICIHFFFLITAMIIRRGMCLIIMKILAQWKKIIMILNIGLIFTAKYLFLLKWNEIQNPCC